MIEQLTIKKNVTDMWAYYLQTYIMQDPENLTTRQVRNSATGKFEVDETWFELTSHVFPFKPADAPALIPHNLFATTKDALTITMKITELED